MIHALESLLLHIIEDQQGPLRHPALLQAQILGRKCAGDLIGLKFPRRI